MTNRNALEEPGAITPRARNGRPLILVAIAAVAACSGKTFDGASALPQNTTGVNEMHAAVRAAQPVASPSYRMLYSFGSGAGDGWFPGPSLIDVKGTFYGVTGDGPGSDGAGTVYSITSTGKEKVIYSFGAGSGDAKFPSPKASLINVNGILYGTSLEGGAYQLGTLYSVTRTGTENVLFSFGRGGGYHGFAPYASLINVDGTFFGTTAEGGKYHPSSGNKGGTVFSFSQAGKRTLLHSFGKRPDAALPFATLINVNGTLYGTTADGGQYHGGTVFSITPNGEERVLYSFRRNSEDGFDPWGALLYVNGKLYGTTLGGGEYRRDIHGGGTVFAITLKGIEKVLHSFGKGSDGYAPEAPLIEVNGTLYGTTVSGGKYGKHQSADYDFAGTVFSVSLTGNETVLHSFGSGAEGSFGKGTDGVDPQSALLNVGGTLYGTTTWGGELGHGTVFTITLPH